MEIVGLQDLVAKLVLPESRLVVTEIERIDNASIVLDCPRSERVVLPVVAIQQIRFSGAGLENPIHVRARVTQRTEFGTKSRYEFQLSPEDGNRLCKLTNRRSAFRVGPDAREPIRLAFKLVGSKKTYRAVVRDISTGGIGALVDSHVEAELAVHDYLVACIKLPGEHGTVEMPGRVHSRRLVGSTILYGFVFDSDSSKDGQRSLEAVRLYTLARQRAIRDRYRESNRWVRCPWGPFHWSPDALVGYGGPKVGTCGGGARPQGLLDSEHELDPQDPETGSLEWVAGRGPCDAPQAHPDPVSLLP